MSMKLAAAAICRVELRPPQPPQSVLHLDVVSAHIASTTVQQICSLSYTALIKEIIDASPKALSVPRVSRIPLKIGNCAKPSLARILFLDFHAGESHGRRKVINCLE